MDEKLFTIFVYINEYKHEHRKSIKGDFRQ